MDSCDQTGLPVGFLDIKGAMRFTSLGRKSLEGAAKAGVLPAYMHGAKRLFKPADLIAFVESAPHEITDESDVVDLRVELSKLRSARDLDKVRHRVELRESQYELDKEMHEHSRCMNKSSIKIQELLWRLDEHGLLP